MKAYKGFNKDMTCTPTGGKVHLASSENYAKLARSGRYAQLASSGDNAHLASSGDFTQLASSGYYAKLASSGKDSVVMSAGIDGKVKAAVGNWIAIAEWKVKDSHFVPVGIVAAKVDGEKIKADTWYMVKNGQLVEAGEE